MKCSCGSSWECVCPTCHQWAPLDEWISVKASLPEEGQHVLVFNEFGCMTVAYYDSYIKEWQSDIGRIYNIIYWQPLPEPPK